MTSSTVAIITGDLIKSQSNSPDEYRHLVRTLEIGIKEVNQRVSIKYELFRGDSFQLEVSEYSRVVEVAILLRLFLKSKHAKGEWDARLGIGIGSNTISTHSIGTSTGDAHRHSGSAFDTIKSERLAFSTKNKELNEVLNLTGRFANNLLVQMTQTQAKFLSYYLWFSPTTHNMLAKQLETSRVNTTQVLNSANYKLIEDYISFSTAQIARVLP